MNDTPLASSLIRSQLDYRDLLQAIVVVKGTFEVLDNGQARLAERQTPVLAEDTQTPFGVLETELVPIKAWCDLAVLGHAYSPSPDRPEERTRVSLRIGDNFVRTLRITGFRAWDRLLGDFHPSSPGRFTKVPLTYEYAFGGPARVEEQLETVLFENPDGIGYVLLRPDVKDTPLPNIEEEDQLIQAWTDRPLPAGVAPLPRHSSLRGARGVRTDEQRKTVHLDSSFFCFAHPRMSLPQYPEQQLVQLDGARENGRWSFHLPPFRYWVRLELGGRLFQWPVAPDTLYLWPDEGKIEVVGRVAFLYQFRPERIRSVRLSKAPDCGVLDATTTIRAVRAAPRRDLPIEIEPSAIIDLPVEQIAQNNPLVDLIESLPLCPSG